MTSQRLAGAPRLIDWTGERCVPWASDPPVIYEHFHRYLFAASLVDGRDVLDLASGEGFGTALLAESARSVVGIDIDQRTVEHSKLNYQAENLEFQVGDARDLSGFQTGSFGAVVAFEMIEHLAEHEQLLEGITRVLAPDGLLILSSPDRTAYSDTREFQNPFHVRELTPDELLKLLEGRFSHVATWAQRTVMGSLVSQLNTENVHGQLQRFVLERVQSDWRLATSLSPMYVIAVVSNAELPALPSDSVLVDPGHELLHHAEAARDGALEAQAQAEQAQERAEQARAQTEQAARAQAEAFEAERADLLAQVAEANALAERERLMNAQLVERAAGDEQVIARLEDKILAAQAFRRTVEGSMAWQLVQRVRRTAYGLIGGRYSPLGRLLHAGLRGFRRVATGRR